MSKVPEDLKYTKDHEWVRFVDGVATIGITEFAQEELGEVVFVELPASGAAVAAGDSVSVVESTKAASDVYSPISGTVQEANAALQDAPDLVNNSPYEDGWMLKLSGVSEEEIGKLLSAAEYAQLIGS